MASKHVLYFVVLLVLMMTAICIPASAAVEMFRVAVENPAADPVPQAPACIDYTLNSKCDVTVEILPSDSAGIPSGDPAIHTETLFAQRKGKHVYVWNCTDNAGYKAPVGYYIARVTATNVGTAPDGTYRWDANIGLYKNWERPAPIHEWPCRDSIGLPYMPIDSVGGTDETINGFYGIGVNHNPDSPYYGRIYASHVTNKHIYMYDVDGTFLGRMNDGAITWMTSAPWDVSVADDGYVYVSDRTNMYVYCFSPDGGAMVSRSPMTTNDRAIFASTAPDGTTYVYVSGGAIIYQLTVAADHTTWTARLNTGQLNTTADTVYGMWVSPDQLTMYVTSHSGTWSGLRRYTRTSTTGTWANDTTWTNNLSGIPLADVEMGFDGSYLWASRQDSNSRCLYKVSTADGAIVANYDIITWAAALDIDSVGNVLCAFGKANATWGRKFFGMFAEPVPTAKVVTTSAFYVPTDPGPVVCPDGEEWTYSNTYAELIPNDLDTATVRFKVMDPDGLSDIGSIQLDLSELKLISDPNKIVPPDSVVPDPSDPDGLTVIATKTVKCVGGVPYGRHHIRVTVRDVHDEGLVQTAWGYLTVSVAANMLNTNISHVRTGALIPGATLRVVGGTPGVYGYPFTFESPYTSDSTGYVEMPIPQGTYALTAARTGYKTQPAVTVDIPVVSAPYGNVTTFSPGVKLGALSIAELRAFTDRTMYCSVEGLVYAQPKGYAPTACPGMDKRLDEGSYRHSFYMCDPTDPTNGMQFQLKMTAAQGDATSIFNRQWDDSAARDPRNGNMLYIGKRPADGDTLCVSGTLETPPGYETRVQIDDGFLSNSSSSTYKHVYYNLTQYGIIPGQPLPAPAETALSDIYHPGSVRWRSSWGRFAQLSNVKVVEWRPDGGYIPPDTGTPPDPNQYVVVVDSTGQSGTVTFQSLTSYGLSANVCPLTVGATYTFKGACGRRCRYGEGTIRPRGAADWTKIGDFTDPGQNTVGRIRGMSGGPVSVRGIVTAVFSDGFYVESPDRSVGVKCTPAQWWVSEGDEVVVTGNVVITGVDKHIAISDAPVVLSSGNAKPELGMRLRDVGGHSIGDYDPGITYARGPLNAGLYVTVQGMVTYRDTTGQSPFFYIWDGTNQQRPGMEPAPVQDDTGHIGLRIAHNGQIGGTALQQYRDFVTIKGIVTLDDTTVPGTVIPVIRPISITPESTFDTVSAASGDVLYWSELTGGANLISIPAQPAKLGNGVSPADGGPAYPWNPTVIFAGAGQDITDGSQAALYRYEDGNLTQYQYDVWAPDAFGGITPSDGYWVYMLAAPWSLSFSGKYPAIPQWYAVENPADSIWIGQPHNYPTELESVQLTDGSAVYSFRDASQHEDGLCLHWVHSVGYWYNPREQAQADVALWDDWSGATALQPWYGYMFQMYEGQKAWIIP